MRERGCDVGRERETNRQTNRQTDRERLPRLGLPARARGCEFGRERERERETDRQTAAPSTGITVVRERARGQVGHARGWGELL